jgi:septal ring factor EnvC (AmiA/AmiB activator)
MIRAAKELLMLAAVAFLLTFASLSFAQTTPTPTQVAAQVKLLTTRTSDLINQLNKLTDENRVLRSNVDLLTSKISAVDNDHLATKAWLDDFTCKVNKLQGFLADKSNLERWIKADAPIELRLTKCNGSDPAVRLTLTSEMLKLFPPLVPLPPLPVAPQ